MKAVIMDNIPLDYGPWLTCSPECLDVLKGLLMRDPAQRMTATEALEHPWFRRHLGEPILPLCIVRYCLAAEVRLMQQSSFGLHPHRVAYTDTRELIVGCLVQMRRLPMGPAQAATT